MHVRDDHVVACGNRGAIWNREGGEWVGTTEVTGYDLHGCWIDPDGYEWAVGGDLITLTAGVVLTDHPGIPPISL